MVSFPPRYKRNPIQPGFPWAALFPVVKTSEAPKERVILKHWFTCEKIRAPIYFLIRHVIFFKSLLSTKLEENLVQIGKKKIIFDAKSRRYFRLKELEVKELSNGWKKTPFSASSYLREQSCLVLEAIKINIKSKVYAESCLF